MTLYFDEILSLNFAMSFEQVGVSVVIIRDKDDLLSSGECENSR